MDKDTLVRIAKLPKPPLAQTIDALRLAPMSLEAARSDHCPSPDSDADRRREAKQAEIQCADRYSAANVPTRYRLTPTVAKHPDWVKAYNLARAVADDAGSTVVLTGPRGTGKTHLACELIRSACWKGITARYETWADILRRWRESLLDGGESERKIVGEFTRVGLLVIDEIEVAKDAEFGDRCLRELIDRRYRNLRSTVMLSNLAVDVLGKKLDPSIVSRMQECGKIIPCNWPSFRAAQTKEVA